MISFRSEQSEKILLKIESMRGFSVRLSQKCTLKGDFLQDQQYMFTEGSLLSSEVGRLRSEYVRCTISYIIAGVTKTTCQELGREGGSWYTNSILSQRERVGAYLQLVNGHNHTLEEIRRYIWIYLTGYKSWSFKRNFLLTNNYRGNFGSISGWWGVDWEILSSDI